MSKHKWIWLQCDHSVGKVASILLKNSFDSLAGNGFRLSQKSKDEVNSTFIERIITHEKIIDPFGAQSDLETVRYQSTRFRLHARTRAEDEYNYLLEVENPPRSVRSLVAALSYSLGGVTIGEVALPVLTIYAELKKRSPRSKIVRLEARDISISDTTSIRLEVNSSTDAFEDFRKLFQGAEGKIEKVRIERPFSGSDGIFELSSTGVCLFDEVVEEEVRKLILDMAV